MSGDWRAAILQFWFGLEPTQWWDGGEQLDRGIRERFIKLWTEKRQLPVESFVSDPLTALAGVILFDQFPRNMFRGDADQFATDPLAIGIAKRAIEMGLNEALAPVERKFLYMPFVHSENMDDQNRAVLLFTEIGDDEQVGYAKKHRDIIDRFGRFPHRNAMLGRSPRPDEIAAGEVVPW